MEREKGKLIHWNDAKGYGFIHPDNDKEDIFLHANAIRHYQRRPRQGDVLTYEVGVDEQDRYYASSAKIIGVAWSGETIVLVAILLLCVFYIYAVFQQLLPFHPLAIYGIMSLLTIWLYRKDKQAAQGGEWRTRERTLHLLELLGGWPGALFAQFSYRHKSRKLSYQVFFWIIVMGHGILWYYLFTHQTLYQSYQQHITRHIASIGVSLKQVTTHFTKNEQTDDSLSPNAQEEIPAQTQTRHRSRLRPQQGARVVEGIVTEIRPHEGVIVSLPSGMVNEGVLDKATLVNDFPRRFVKGEHLQVAIHSVTIERSQKRIELVLVED